MKWLDRLRRPAPVLDEATRASIAAWRRAVIVRPHTPTEVAEFVVVDTETSGLDVRHHTLLSIGAVLVRERRVVMGESFYREIRPDKASDRENVVIHGIGHAAQLAGEDPARVLADFMAFAGGRPLVAYNAPFDREMIEAAVDRHLGMRWQPVWIDTTELVRAMFPAEAMDLKTLDDWMGRFGLVHYERHNALADALCTAQLFQILVARAQVEGYLSVKDLLRAEKQHHWQRKR